MTIKHSKTNTIPDWTQANLNAEIALGNFPVGTTLAQITQPSDWDADHVISNQTANTVLAGPTSGAAATPNFRALVAADIPTAIAAGSNTQIQFNNSNALGASANLVWNGTSLVSSSNIVAAAGNAALAFAGNTQTLQVQGNTASTGSMVLSTFATGNNSELVFYRSKNATVGSATVVANGDILGRLSFYGAQQTGTFATQSIAAQIRAEIDGIVTSGAGGDMPGRLIFATTSDGSGIQTTRMTISSTGLVSISGNLAVTGTITATSTIGASNFSGSSSGTNTGDQTITSSDGTLTVSTNDIVLNLSSANTWLANVGIYSPSTIAFFVAATSHANNFVVDTSSGNPDTGISVIAQKASDGAQIQTISTGTKEALYIDAKGNLGIFLNNASNGPVITGGPLQIGTNVAVFGGVGTSANGVPVIRGYGNFDGLTAQINPFASCTVGAGAGTFYIGANVLITASTLFNFTVRCDYTDEGNTARTLVIPFSNLAGTFLTAITNAAGAVPYEGATLTIRAKTGTSINLYTTGTFTTVTYNVRGFITEVSPT